MSAAQLTTRWRPIAEAPRNRVLLVLDPKPHADYGPEVHPAAWSADHGFWIASTGVDVDPLDLEPIAFLDGWEEGMPLPPTPTWVGAIGPHYQALAVRLAPGTSEGLTAVAWADTEGGALAGCCAYLEEQRKAMGTAITRLRTQMDRLARGR